MNKFATTSLAISLVLGLSLAPLAGASEGALGQAISAYEEAEYERAKTLLQQQQESAEQQIYLGKVAFAQKQLDDAEALFERAIELAPDNAEAHYMLGNASMMLAADASIFTAPGYASTAKESLAKAIELEPGHVDANVAMIQFLTFAPGIAGGDIDKAEQMAKELAQYSKLDSLLVSQAIYRKNEQPEQLAALANQLSTEFSSSAKGMLTAGFIYQDREEYGKAFEAFSAANKLAPEDKKDHSPEMALYQMGKTAVLAENQLAAGMASLTQYLSLDLATSMPSKAWANYRLAQLTSLTGDRKSALALAKKLKKETDDDRLESELKRFIKQLKKS